jgi:hypothetical protein
VALLLEFRWTSVGCELFLSAWLCKKLFVTLTLRGVAYFILSVRDVSVRWHGTHAAVVRLSMAQEKNCYKGTLRYRKRLRSICLAVSSTTKEKFPHSLPLLYLHKNVDSQNNLANNLASPTSWVKHFLHFLISNLRIFPPLNFENFRENRRSGIGIDDGSNVARRFSRL